MKKLTLGLVLFCITQSARAAEDTLKLVNVSVQPLGFIVGTANITADFGISDIIAIGPNFSYNSQNVGSDSSGGTISTQIMGFGIGADVFLNQKRFTDGWVFTAELGYQTMSLSFPSTSKITPQSGSGIGAQLSIGYQWYWPVGLNLGFQLGTAFSSAQLAGYSVSSITPALGFQLGWVF